MGKDRDDSSVDDSEKNDKDEGSTSHRRHGRKHSDHKVDSKDHKRKGSSRRDERRRDADDDEDEESKSGDKEEDDDRRSRRRKRTDEKDNGDKNRHERKRSGSSRRQLESDEERSDDDSRSMSDESSEEHRKHGRRRKDSRKRHRKHKKSSSKKASKHRHRSSSSKHKKKKRRKKSYSSSSESDSSSDNSSDDSQSDKKNSSGNSSSDSEDYRTESAATITQKVLNNRLLAKLAARGETLEERRERRAAKRAAYISAQFGYTAEDNPFNDPNLHETFTWNKKQEKKNKVSKQNGSDSKPEHVNTLEEIEKVRRRRKEREMELEERERIRAEESRMKELENYDDWARKEELFHLQQQRQRSAIRLVEGREKPIDVLAQNLLLFGLSEQEKQEHLASVKYKEKFNALEALETIEAELEEPQDLLKVLKLSELEELLIDINAFRRLEREAADVNTEGNQGRSESENPALRYWDALYLVACDEIKYLKSGGDKGSHASLVHEIQKIFQGQSSRDLLQMKRDLEEKLSRHLQPVGAAASVLNADGTVFDRDYWQSVLDQLSVHLAKVELSDLHSKMLVRQLEKLEQRKEELERKNLAADGTAAGGEEENGHVQERGQGDTAATETRGPDSQVGPPEWADLEEELGLKDEVDMPANMSYSWQDKYRPRKPRYFNRVKTGYDWNKYNQTHYDHDNPPPKIVQGYKFNIFYPDLIDPTKTPQYVLEPADSDDFCIIRFRAGPLYEDVAFKILNRQWNKSRKRGFKCTFERGVLSLYFNFATHWYRR